MPSRPKITTLALCITGVAFLVFTIWIIHEANIGRDNLLFKTVRATPYGDKIGHLFLAGFLTLVLNFFLGSRALRLGKLILPLGSLIVFAIAVVEEASQYYLPTRNFDLFDALANLLGITLFSIPAIIAYRRKKRATAN